MLSLTSGRLIAHGNKKDNDFKLYFKDEDGDPHISVKDVFALFDKAEIHFFLDDYSLNIDKFKTLLEMTQNQEILHMVYIGLYIRHLGNYKKKSERK